MTKVTSEKKWGAVATTMGYSPLNAVKIGALLKSHYERILYPLDIFEKEEAAKAKDEVQRQRQEIEKQLKEEKKGRMAAKMSKVEKAEEDSKMFSKELAR